MSGPTKNLTWDELKCNDGTPYPHEWIKNGRVYKLARAFEQIRTLCGSHPIHIYSAYRTSEWNKKVGGAPKSQHMYGRALDLHHTTLTNEEFHRLIKAYAVDFGIGGVGLYKRFVHIDIRETDRLYAWRSTMKKESLV